MILVTGAAGFIGSAFVWQLNENGINDIIISDKLQTEEKWKNIAKRDYYDWVDRDELFEWLEVEENAEKNKSNSTYGSLFCDNGKRRRLPNEKQL